MKHLISLAVLMVITISAASANQRTFTSNKAYTTGCLYYTQGDTVNALKCWRRATKAGSDEGLYSLGFCTINGLGIKANPKAGLKMIRRAAMRAEPNALYYLGTLYETGACGIIVNKHEALRLFQEASKMGSFEGLVACGNLYFSSGDTITAINFWKRAAEEAPILPTDGLRTALAKITYNLGFFYQYGIGTVRDLYEASLYYLKSIHYGNKNDATYQLGLLYLNNENEPDQNLAAYYFSLAAKSDNYEAYVQLGHTKRYNGNEEQALTYYLTAAHGGSANGMYCLASLYYDYADYRSAVYWADQCIRCKENSLAEYLLGLAHYSLKEYAQAKYYFQRCVYIYHLDDAISMLNQIDSGECYVGNGIVEL